MEILEAYDLTGSFRQAAVLVGCDHKTVAHWVEVREATGGAPPARARHRRPVADPVAGKVEELVDRSRGQIGADQAHSKLVAMGYEGSERTTRRASRRLSAAGGRSMGGAPGRGSLSRGCGFSGTMGRGRWSRALGRCCSARGLRGLVIGWWCRCAIRRWRRS